MSTKRDFLETEKTPGWSHYRAQVESRIESLRKDLATIETEGKTADQIGVEYVKITERIEGLTQALGVTEDIKRESADDI